MTATVRFEPGRWLVISQLKIVLRLRCGETKLPLTERTYQCDSCGLVIDRDLNAAVNLARYAQRQTDPSTGSSPVEPTIRPHPRVMLVAMKPEPEPK